MKSIAQNFKDLRKAISQTSIVWNFVFVFEVVFVTALGILSNKVQNIDFASGSFLLLIVFSVLYIVTKLFFIYAKQPLNSSSVDELEAKFELNLYTKRISRINIINETISKSIHKLNDRTCQMNMDAMPDLKPNNICEQNLKEGLTIVLTPFMKNISAILDSNNIKYTLGIFIENFYHLDYEDRVLMDDHIVVINDDLEFERFIPPKLFTTSDTSGFSLEIQSVMKKLFNNENTDFLIQNISNDNKFYTMILSIIPCVCSGERKEGINFIIIEPTSEELPDLNSTLDIFNRIIANWLSLYQECVFRKAGIAH